jgi:cytochrome c553
MPRALPTARTVLSSLLSGLLFGLVLCLAASAQESIPDLQAERGVEFFENRVRPMLVENCVRCHGPKKQKSGLRLDTPGALLAGGERGSVIVAGDPDASLLVAAIRYDDIDLQMPPDDRLPQEDIDALERWVREGAHLPQSAAAAETSSHVDDFDFEARAQHWCFAPLANNEVPRVDDGAWGRDPLDAFVLSRLEQAGLAPAREADRPALIRRLAFDLTGLPPSVDELDAFLSDEREDAYESLVDRLLGSPDFSETWARHWLDLVRYAETSGHEFDYPIPNAFEYRDYVVRAFDQDVPYDRFVEEHVAGDLLPEARPNVDAGWDESPLGTGFWYLGESVHSPVDIRQDQVERIANQIDVFSKTFLGLTVACARCHDHKFDAITAKDYYALSGYMLSSRYRQVRYDTRETNTSVAAELASLRRSMASGAAEALGLTLAMSAAGLAESLGVASEVLRREQAQSSEAVGAGDLSEEERTAAVAKAQAARLALVVELAPDVDDRTPRRIVTLVDQLLAAGEDRSHVLHPLTRAAGTDPGVAVPAVSDLLMAWNADTAATKRFLALAQSLLDFGRQGPLSSPAWLVDGPTFGSAPVIAGQPTLEVAGAALRFSFQPYAAAVEDRNWRGLSLVDGTEREPGSVSWDRAGRTLATATVTLERSAIYSLVRGSGHAWAVVDSHRLIKGPLHGRQLISWRADGDGLRWVKHDLADYLGHRVHVEFTPATGASDDPALEVLLVVASDESPGPAELPIESWRAELEARNPETLAARAVLLEDLVVEAALDLADGALARAPGVASRSRLLRWLSGLSSPRIGVLLDTSEAMAAHDVLARRRLRARTAPAMIDGSGVDEQLLIRGSHRSPADAVPRRTLSVLAAPPSSTRGSGRLTLARSLTAEGAYLLARVQVNRLWKHLFGRGLVASVDNMGVMGSLPSHPQLLDHLAVRFVESGWSNKALIRAIVCSSTYRLASATSELGMRLDPDNVLLHRAPVKRLTAEALRDAILHVSGGLDGQRFGPSVPLHLTPFLQGRGRPGESGPLDGAGRRSLYISVRRNFAHPLLQVFDLPTPATTIGRRNISNVPAQALALMNDPFVVGEAQRWADRTSLAGASDPAARVAAMYRAAFARRPSDAEVERALAFVGASDPDKDAGGWADLAHVLFNTKEFLFLN